MVVLCRASASKKLRDVGSLQVGFEGVQVLVDLVQVETAVGAQVLVGHEREAAGLPADGRGQFFDRGSQFPGVTGLGVHDRDHRPGPARQVIGDLGEVEAGVGHGMLTRPPGGFSSTVVSGASRRAASAKCRGSGSDRVISRSPSQPLVKA